jgi:hypothetical protein
MSSVQRFEHLVISHGYWALLIRALFEGETIPIIGGLCAKLGLLKLSTVKQQAVDSGHEIPFPLTPSPRRYLLSCALNQFATDKSNLMSLEYWL